MQFFVGQEELREGDMMGERAKESFRTALPYQQILSTGVKAA
jgi:hypothetical protein